MTKNKNVIRAWCLYDWGSSAHPTLITTFVFSVYFAGSVYGDPTAGAAFWAYLAGIGALITAIVAPLVGILADHDNRHKQWLIYLTSFCCMVTACLWFVEPDPSFIWLATPLVILSLASFELAVSMNNAMLPKMLEPYEINKYSNMGWALGYFGGLTVLAICLALFMGVGDSFSPVFSLNQNDAHHVRITPVMTGLWFLLFSLPLFVLYKNQQSRQTTNRPHVFKTIAADIKALFSLKDKTVLTFLVASAIYRDGLTTLFAIGGIYTSDVYDFSLQDILLFAIALNISSGVGGFIFALLHRKLGSYQSIVISLLSLAALIVLIIFVDDRTTFFVLACVLGLFIGPAQSASRSFMAEISPPDKIAQYFGFYALTGKSIAITGPILYGLAVSIFDDQRAGMVVIATLLLIGLFVFLKIKSKNHHIVDIIC